MPSWLPHSWRKRISLLCLLDCRRARQAGRRGTVLPLVELLEGRVLPSVVLNYREYHDPSRIPAGLKPSRMGILPQDNGFPFPIGYTPDQLQTAYGIDRVMLGNVVGDGSGQTIAIVDAYDDPAFLNTTDPNYPKSDLGQFDSQLGFPDPPSFLKVNQNGQTSPLPRTDPSGAGNPNGNWEIEEALDIEWAHGIALGANILFVEANSDSNADLFTAVANAAAMPGVSAVSMSWGLNEYNGENALDPTFVTPNGHPGVTFLAASGDVGGFSYNDQGGATTTPGILYPAASPNVVSVGGTSLNLNDDDSYQSETAWSGSGGGTSLFEPEPSYQQNSQRTGHRTIPDVAFDADLYTGVAVYDSYNNTDNNGAWVQVGGTSLGAPSWAALIAIANQGRVLAGGAPLDGALQTLPALYAISPTDFNDITSGNNGVFGAGPGYDEVTGLGSPSAPALMADLATYGTANHIGLTSQPPANVIVGDRFGIVVQAENPAGGRDPAFAGTLTIALATDPSSATLGGSLTATAVDGVAVFDGLTLDRTGNGFTIKVTSAKFSSITTNAFNAVPDPTPWQGTFYPVPTDASLRTAIDLADSNGYAFNTLLLSASTYLVSDDFAGTFVIQNSSSLASKTLTIAGQGQPSTVIGSGYNWHDRIFEIEGSGGQSLDVTFQGLTIQGGRAPNGGVLGGNDALGGGLLIDNANVVLANDVVQNNQAQGAQGAAGKAGAKGAKGGVGGAGANAKGGGIYLFSGSLTLFNVTVSGNAARGGAGGAGGTGGGQGTKSAPAVTAGPGGTGGPGGFGAGGGIYAAGGTVRLDRVLLSSNQAVGGTGGTGGMGGSGGHGQKSSTRPGKTGGPGGAGGAGGAANGGAIYLAGGSLTLTSATIQGNSALGGPGGIGGYGGIGTALVTTLTAIFGGSGSTLNFGNLAPGVGGPGGHGGHGGAGGAAAGGGVYVAGGSFTLVTTTLADNDASGGPGGTGGHGGSAGFGPGTSSLGLPIGETGGQGGTGGNAGLGQGGGLYVAGGKVVVEAVTLKVNGARGGNGGAGGTGGNGPLAALASSGLGTGFSGTGTGSGTGTFGSHTGFLTAGPGGNGGKGGTGKGGGLYVGGGTLTLTNVTVAVNTAGAGSSGSSGRGGRAGTGKITGGYGLPGNPGTSFGGGLFVSHGSVNLDNCTVALNIQAGNGSGGGADVQSPGTITALSTLFAGNGPVNFSGTVTATDSLFQTSPTGTLSGSGNLVGVNPLFDTHGLQSNGGPTQTIALQASSPAIGKGANSENLFADHRGYGPRSGPGGTDIGAYQTGAQADTQAPTSTLQAQAVNPGNSSALNPYTFTITYSDNLAVSVSTLANAVVEILPPGSAAPILATVTSIQTVGAADGVGDAGSFLVTYQITPPGGSWSGAPDGTYTVSLGGGTVTDLAGNPVATGALGTFTVTQNLSAAISGPSDGYSGVAGQTRTYTLSASDPSSTQQALGFTYSINWGDGETDTIGPGAASPATVSHVYLTPGTYTITLTATDQAGTFSPPIARTATILGFELQGNNLAIGGTTGDDSFGIAAGAKAGILVAKVNGVTIGKFQAGAAAIFGDGGTDKATITGISTSANTFTLSGSTATFTAASFAPITFTIGLNNISQVTFLGGNAGNAFTNTGAAIASVLQGGSGTNTYTIVGTQMGAPVTVRGRGTANFLYGPTLAGGAANVWKITGANAGTLNGSSWSFTGVQNLIGGDNDDHFTIASKGSLSGLLNGGAGTNTLTGPNLTDTFDLTGTNAGTLADGNGVLQFTSIQDLIGGTGTNNFVFGAAAAVSGTIAGHGVSRLDYSAYGSAVYVNLLTGVATGTGGVSHISQVYGSGDNDVLVGNGSGVLLSEQTGDNLLIAGTGSGVMIDSGSGEDLVIAGSTSYDKSLAALEAIDAYWAANVGSSFASTVAALSTGISGGYKLTTFTVKHHGTGDFINLGSANDWLFWRMTGTDPDTLTGTPEQSKFI